MSDARLDALNSTEFKLHISNVGQCWSGADLPCVSGPRRARWERPHIQLSSFWQMGEAADKPEEHVRI